MRGKDGDWKYGRLFIIAGLVVAVDQISKMIVIESMPLYSRIQVIPGFFNITHIHNPGGAFGFLAGHSPVIRQFLFVAVALLAIALIVYYYARTPSAYRLLSAALALILGGAVGNLIDRLRFGIVVDFLDVYVKDIHWPAFNVADSAITVGMGIFIFHMLFRKMPE